MKGEEEKSRIRRHGQEWNIKGRIKRSEKEQKGLEGTGKEKGLEEMNRSGIEQEGLAGEQNGKVQMEWIEWEGLDGMGIEQEGLEEMDRMGKFRWNGQNGNILNRKSQKE